MIKKLTTHIIRQALEETGLYLYRNGNELRELHNSLDDQAFTCASLVNDLSLDSVDIASLITYLEDEGFTFERKDVAKCKTVADLIAIAKVK